MRKKWEDLKRSTVLRLEYEDREHLVNTENLREPALVAFERIHDFTGRRRVRGGIHEVAESY